MLNFYGMAVFDNDSFDSILFNGYVGCRNCFCVGMIGDLVDD